MQQNILIKREIHHHSAHKIMPICFHKNILFILKTCPRDVLNPIILLRMFVSLASVVLWYYKHFE